MVSVTATRKPPVNQRSRLFIDSPLGRATEGGESFLSQLQTHRQVAVCRIRFIKVLCPLLKLASLQDEAFERNYQLPTARTVSGHPVALRG